MSIGDALRNKKMWCFVFENESNLSYVGHESTKRKIFYLNTSKRRKLNILHLTLDLKKLYLALQLSQAMLPLLSVSCCLVGPATPPLPIEL